MLGRSNPSLTGLSSKTLIDSGGIRTWPIDQALVWQLDRWLKVVIKSVQILKQTELGVVVVCCGWEDFWHCEGGVNGAQTRKGSHCTSHLLETSPRCISGLMPYNWINSKIHHFTRVTSRPVSQRFPVRHANRKATLRSRQHKLLQFKEGIQNHKWDVWGRASIYTLHNLVVQR